MVHCCHHHDHSKRTYNGAFAIGIALNLIFVVVEFTYGWLANSMALIADAGHNLSDVFSLMLAWGANVLSMQKPTSRRTYGFRRVPILASLLSAILLCAALGGIAWEAVERFRSPLEVNSFLVIVVAAIGFVINAITAILFHSGQKNDLNIRGAFLHMAADAIVSLGVVLVGVIMLMTKISWIDPVVSLLIVAIIFIGTWGLLRDSVHLAIDSVPCDIDPEKVIDYLNSLQGVEEVHDLHIWAVSTTEIAMTVHLVIPIPIDDAELHDQFLLSCTEQLHEQFQIDHTTIQIERGKGAVCLQADPASL